VTSLRHLSYSIRAHSASLGTLRLSPLVDSRQEYRPTDALARELLLMWRSRRPEVVGHVTEMLGAELLEGACLTVDKSTWRLSCLPIRRLSGGGRRWIPKLGLRSDDLMTIGFYEGRRLYFPTEVKGSILSAGVRRSNEAKMFYQLPRTLAQGYPKVPSDVDGTLGGAITIVVNHWEEFVVVNAIPAEAQLVRPE